MSGAGPERSRFPDAEFRHYAGFPHPTLPRQGEGLPATRCIFSLPPCGGGSGWGNPREASPTPADGRFP